MNILFVCLGNICRSPLAEGIMHHKVREHGLKINVDSAGTASWHSGEKPDNRGIKIAKSNGIDISRLRARQFSVADFDEFDFIFAMDESNYSDLQNLARSDSDLEKIKLFTEFAGLEGVYEVPDPYYDGRFAEVFDLIDHACNNVIKNFKK